MHFSTLTLVVTSIMAPAVLCQTPPGTSPATYTSLAVNYGNTKVTPGIQLPLSLTSTIPTFSHISSSNQTYSLLLLDLSTNSAQINTSLLTPGIQVPLVPGITAGRTTYLHYWQPGVTFSTNGTLVNTTEPIAFYSGPAPPPGDGPHTYVVYLFKQGAGFAPPPAGNPFSTALVNKNNGLNRVSFNVNHLANEQGIGPLVAATYFSVENTAATTSSGGAAATGTGSATAAGTGDDSSSVSGGTKPPSPSPFTGGAVQISTGLMGGILTFVAVSFALLFMS